MLALAGAFRKSEVVALNVEDLESATMAFVSPSGAASPTKRPGVRPLLYYATPARSARCGCCRNGSTANPRSEEQIAWWKPSHA
jgi:hypothetical protein